VSGRHFNFSEIFSVMRTNDTLMHAVSARELPVFVSTKDDTLVATVKNMQDIATLKEDVASLKEDVASIKEDVASIKEDLATFKKEIKEGMTSFKEELMAELKRNRLG
jgi:peptidoglycan hydrolase CwlO-like protein